MGKATEYTVYTGGRRPQRNDAGDILMVTRQEAARRLSLSTTEIDEARRRGDLAAQKYGTKVLISVDELRRFAEALPADEA
jgi:excisionase family DNA binding protein